MKLTKQNMYIKQHGSATQFVLWIEMPDNSRNYLHTSPMALSECVHLMDDLIDYTIENDCNEPYFMMDEGYYRLHFTVPAAILSTDSDIDFHSRKLNLNDIVAERRMLLEWTKKYALSVAIKLGIQTNFVIIVKNNMKASWQSLEKY